MHEAQTNLLRQMVEECGIGGGANVLDLGSGDGFFAEQLCHLVGPDGHVTGVDLDERCLDRARQRCREAPAPCTFVRANAEAIPWPEASFDACFSALSFFDFTHPLTALEEMKRVTRPGGLIVVIEHDSNHQALFPFPSAVELALNQALKRASSDRPGVGSRYYAARHLPEWMSDEGLVDVQRSSYSKDFSHPLSQEELRYVESFLDELSRLADPFLDDEARSSFQAYRRGQTDRPTPNSAGFSATFFHFVTTGRLPSGPRPAKGPARHETR